MSVLFRFFARAGHDQYIAITANDNVSVLVAAIVTTVTAVASVAAFLLHFTLTPHFLAN